MAQPTRQMPSSGQDREVERSEDQTPATDVEALVQTLDEYLRTLGMSTVLRTLEQWAQQQWAQQREDKARSEEDGSSSPAPSIVLSDEEFEAFQEALRKPQSASPALRALFASKRKL
jgi:hypothetical protein